MTDYKNNLHHLSSIITNPLVALLLTPMNGLLFGTLLALKSSSFSWRPISILFYFLAIVFIQETIYYKANKMKKIVTLMTILITNIFAVTLLIYFWNNFNHEITYLSLIILLLNHVQLFITDTTHGLYYYHVIFKTISYYGLGNFIAYYLLAGAVIPSFVAISLPFILLALSLTNIKQKKHSDNSELKAHSSTYVMQTFLQFIFGIMPLVSYIIIFAMYHNHFTLTGIIFMILTIVCFLFIKVAAKKHLTTKQYLTALQWYALLFTICYAIFYTI
ncbi:hypothetical protein SAMN05421767_11429 [Granulicatella balaenopterae]|uniref:Uncharacterized protein n=1 Tax=Granulicatella balaenopterae TaxID=137733 RepID=A0A1H9KLF6_9LACT|nr:hypothetical protein [Granulicatella balaenopterae]SEQ99703.1 hypothetical protein SAMN05421767_11429 [Granulicatella balaenopterae]